MLLALEIPEDGLLFFWKIFTFCETVSMQENVNGFCFIYYWIKKIIWQTIDFENILSVINKYFRGLDKKH